MSDATKIQIEDVRRLVINPGEIVVLRIANVSPEIAQEILAQVRAGFPDVRWLVLPNTITIDVIAPDTTEEPA
jgi:hypothetical protein